MKPPKEPKTFKRPRIYWQEAISNNWNPNREEYCCGSRMRIIYPCGKAEFIVTDQHYHYERQSWEKPCWLEKTDSAETTINLMRKYDRNTFKKKAIFLGEL